MVAKSTEGNARVVPLASTLPDAGWGSVWPVAILFGSACAAAMSGGAWLGAELLGDGVHPDGAGVAGFATWVAEHAAWGTALGAFVTLALRLVARRWAKLRGPAQRRAVAAGSVVACTIALLLALLITLSVDARQTLAAGSGIVLGFVLWILGVRLWLRRSPRTLEELPRLDPARVAILVALLTIPLAPGRASRAGHAASFGPVAHPTSPSPVGLGTVLAAGVGAGQSSPRPVRRSDEAGPSLADGWRELLSGTGR